MAFQIRCPNNHQLLVDDEHLGHKVRCPTCQALMVVGSPKEGPSSRTRRRGGISIALRLQLTRMGLAFHYGRLLCILLGTLSLIAWTLLDGLTTGIHVESEDLNRAMALLIGAFW